MVYNGENCSTYTMVQLLKALNPRLKVCSFESSPNLAGIYTIERNGEWTDICGIDKKYVPCYAKFDDGGHMIQSGWRRVCWVMLGAGYTTKAKIQKACPGFFDSRACRADRFVGGIQGDPIQNKIMKYTTENNFGDPFGEATLTSEQALDIAKDIAQKDTIAAQEQRNRERWFLQTWQKRGGTLADKPTI